MKEKTIHHVFVFRHCVRSTHDHVKLHTDSSSSSSSSSEKIPISDFFSASTPMPGWNTPPYWCTETGAKIIKGTGGFLLKDVILGETNANTDAAPRKISIQIVTDTNERDSTTSFELYDGLRKTANDLNKHLDDSEKISIDGLSELTYDPLLFKPEDEDFCEAPKENPQRMFQAVSDRISLLPPPQDAAVALTKMANLAGTGTRSLVDEPKDGYYSLSESSGYEKFEGPLNALKLMSQMVFYSRASGLPKPFLPAASLKDVMSFAQWVSWTRSVLEVDNSNKALSASTMGPAIIHALQTGKHRILGRHSEKSPSHDGDEVDASVVIFVGHDGDLDTIASAFGLGWTLGPPYLDREHSHQITNTERESILSTPPGAGFHFRYSVDDDSLSISYLYPAFFNSSNALNTTGILERTPVYLRSSFGSGDADASFAVETDKVSNVLRIQTKTPASSNALDFLQSRLSKAVSSHLEADEMDCYSKTMEELRVLGPSCKSLPWSSSTTCTTIVSQEAFYRIGFYILLGLLAFLSAMTALRKIRRRGQRASRKEFDTLPQLDDCVVNDEIEIT